MAKGKHEAPSPGLFRKSGRGRTSLRARRRRRNIIPLVAALVLTSGVAAGSTMAYLTDNARLEGNTYEAGVVSYEIINDCVKNTGNIDAYVKVTLVQNYVDENGNVCAAHEVPQLVADRGWLPAGTDAYSLVYSKPLAPGEATAPVPQGAIMTVGSVAEDNCTARLNVFASAIQAEPASAVLEAWGFIPGA